jgi:hypothetical protein
LLLVHLAWDLFRKVKLVTTFSKLCFSAARDVCD